MEKSPASRPIAKPSLAQRRISLAARFWFVFGLAAVASVAYALHMGQDLDWDLLNYHYYDVYAFLAGRSAIDIGPAQLESWFCPFGDLFQYSAITHLPPLAASVLFATVAAISIGLVYLIADMTLRSDTPDRLRLLLCALAALGAWFAPIFLSELGTAGNDYVSSILILACLVLVMGGRFSVGAYFAAGLVLGAAVAAKLTNGLYVPGLSLAILAVEGRRFLRPLFAAGLGACLTYLPSGGAWDLYLYLKYRNPLFPMFNNIFHSPDFWSLASIDDSTRARSLAAAFSYFPKWMLGVHTTAAIHFVDIRFLLALVVLSLALPQVLLLLFRDDLTDRVAPFAKKQSVFLIVFCVTSFCVWMWLYAIQRYIIALEQIATLLIFILLALLCGSRTRFLSAAVMCVAAIMAVTGLPRSNWGRVPFGESWFAVDVPPQLKHGGVLYVMVSGAALSYVVPFFPKSDAFVRIEWVDVPPIVPTIGLGRQIREKIDAYRGEIRTLAPAEYQLRLSLPDLEMYGLKPVPGSCVEISTKPQRLQSCRLVRIGTGAGGV